jgi:hypothetical protein
MNKVSSLVFLAHSAIDLCEDQEWLDVLNAERKKEQLNKVSYETFEIIMDRLEKEWFDLVRLSFCHVYPSHSQTVGRPRTFPNRTSRYHPKTRLVPSVTTLKAKIVMPLFFAMGVIWRSIKVNLGWILPEKQSYVFQIAMAYHIFQRVNGYVGSALCLRKTQS